MKKTMNFPAGPMSGKLFRNAIELKALVQRGMTAGDVEEATMLCDRILAESGRVESLENNIPVVVCMGRDRGVEKPSGPMH